MRIRSCRGTHTRPVLTLSPSGVLRVTCRRAMGAWSWGRRHLRNQRRRAAECGQGPMRMHLYYPQMLTLYAITLRPAAERTCGEGNEQGAQHWRQVSLGCQALQLDRQRTWAALRAPKVAVGRPTRAPAKAVCIAALVCSSGARGGRDGRGEDGQDGARAWVRLLRPEGHVSPICRRVARCEIPETPGGGSCCLINASFTPEILHSMAPTQ